MHGLILAGGDGSRLLASGVTRPKALVEIGGRSQVERLVATAFRLGCESVTCAIREDLHEEVSRALRVTAAHVVPLRTASSLHTLVAGLEHVGTGEVFCTMVDTVMPDRDWRRAHDHARQALTMADAVVAVTPFVDDASPLWVDAGADGRVRAFGVRGLRPIATGGVYWLGTDARSAAAEAQGAGTMRMRGYLAQLVESGRDVRVVEVAKIVDVDTRDDLNEALALIGDDA